jgi:hypothetical protein
MPSNALLLSRGVMDLLLLPATHILLPHNGVYKKDTDFLLN